MITAVDTNVLLDVFLDDREHSGPSLRALERCGQEGALIVGDVVLAELSAILVSLDPIEILEHARIEFVGGGADAAIDAGRRWSANRRGSKGRVVADFLVGAHAVEHADRLLTRDRGFYRKAFTGLTVIEPA